MLLSLFTTSLVFSRPLMLLMSYVSIGNSFPKPLSEKDEEHYLTLYEQGNEEAKNILIERNLRLVAHIVKKYGNTGKDPDDLISIGTIGLIKSINTYDKNKGTRLATYSARCIENEILMNIRAGRKNKTEVSLHEPIGIDKEGNEISFNDILGTEADSIVDDVDIRIQVKKLYNRIANVLKGREKTVIMLRYGLAGEGCKTQREIAKLLGISRSYVSRIEKKAVAKLREEFEGEMN